MNFESYLEMYFSKFIKKFVFFSTFMVPFFPLYIKSLIIFEFVSGREVRYRLNFIYFQMTTFWTL